VGERLNCSGVSYRPRAGHGSYGVPGLQYLNFSSLTSDKGTSVSSPQSERNKNSNMNSLGLGLSSNIKAGKMNAGGKKVVCEY
jgi:hypothetical protein